MKMNQDLLKKYYQGTASKEERKCAEAWLDEGYNECYKEFIPDETSFMKKKMWNGILQNIKAENKKKLYILTMKAAACILLFVTGAMWLNANLKMHISTFANNENEGNIIIEHSELLCELTPESKVTIDSRSLISQECKVVVDGNISFKPTSDRIVTFFSKDDDGEPVSYEKRCKKGETYYVINYKFRSSNELLIVDKSELENLPASVQFMAIDEFSIAG